MHARIAATLTVIVALVGCSSEGAGTDAGADMASPDATMDVDLGTPDAGCADGGCTSMLTFAPSADAPRALDHHATFLVTTAAGTWLYIAGGNDYTRTFAEVSRALVHGDGTLGAWEDGPALPTPRAGMGVVVDGTHVWLTGGKNFGNPLPDVLAATVQSDGTLTAWEPTTALPAGRFHHVSFGTHGFLYVIGGLEIDSAVDTVLRADIHTDGTLGTWTAQAPLPRALSHQGMALAGGHVFLSGGLDGAPTGTYTDLDDVLRATVNADGSLGTWENVGHLDGARATHASFAHDGYLYIVGGLLFDSQTVRVDRATLSADGTLGTDWERFVFLPEARSHVHHTPVTFDRYLYSVGGQLADGHVTAHVFIGTFQ